MDIDSDADIPSGEEEGNAEDETSDVMSRRRRHYLQHLIHGADRHLWVCHSS